MSRPDILFIMTDQQRFDTIAALGNSTSIRLISTVWCEEESRFQMHMPLVRFCVAARYTIRTGCEPPTTRVFSNAKADPVAGQPAGNGSALRTVPRSRDVEPRVPHVWNRKIPHVSLGRRCGLRNALA